LAWLVERAIHVHYQVLRPGWWAYELRCGFFLADAPGVSFVAKILRGAKPADLPLEQVDRFEFVLNLKTAKAIGATLPTSTLLRADQIIE
jgi:ABC transporter substrate binding protein